MRSGGGGGSGVDDNDHDDNNDNNIGMVTHTGRSEKARGLKNPDSRVCVGIETEPKTKANLIGV